MIQKYKKGYNHFFFIKTSLCEQKTGSKKPMTQNDCCRRPISVRPCGRDRGVISNGTWSLATNKLRPRAGHRGPVV